MKDQVNNVNSAAHTDMEKKKNLVDIHKDKFQLARRNTIKTALIVGMSLIICWSQAKFSYLIYNIGYPIERNTTSYKSTLLMLFFNCTVN